MQELNGRNIHNRQPSTEDFPSAPPISGSFGEIKQEKDLSSHSKENYISSRVDSHEFVAKSSVKKTTPIVDEKPSHTDETSNPSRSVFFILKMCNLTGHSPNYLSFVTYNKYLPSIRKIGGIWGCQPQKLWLLLDSYWCTIELVKWVVGLSGQNRFTSQ